MRLPQSSIRSLVVYTIHFLTISFAISVVISLVCSTPAEAKAPTPQLVGSPNNLQFGAVVLGQTQTLLVPVTNTGQASVTISGVTVRNPEFSVSNVNLPLVLAAGQSVDVNVNFTPTVMGWRGGTVTFASNATNANFTIEVAGSGTNGYSITASPAAISFGQVAMGGSSTIPVVLSNLDSWRVNVSSIQVSGSEFAISGAAFPMTIGGGQSVTVNVVFTPTSAGMVGGSLFVVGPKALTIPLTGMGAAVGQLTVAPASMNFGSIPDGTTGTQTISLSAVGSSVTVSSGSSSSAQFVLSGASFPLTIPAGQSASFHVAFTPQNTGMASGALSFASNASAGSASVNIPLTGAGTAVTGQLTVTPASVNFGSIPDGTTGTQSISLSASGASVTVSSGSSNSSQFVLSGGSFPMTIPAGQSASFKVTFTPQTSGSASGSLSFASNASTTPTVSLAGAGTAVIGQLTVSPASLNFGSVVDGTTQSQPITLSATGASVTISSDSSSSSQFVLSGASFPMTIPAGQTASFKVVFTPQSTGSISGALSFASNASTAPSVTFAGSGTAATGQLSITPASLNFGSVVDGTTQSQPITLSATGASVTISSDSSSSSQFVLSGASFPMTIPAGQTASFKVVFTPQSTGSISGALSFASNASTAPSVTFAGSGTAATGQLSITPASLNFGSVVDGTTQSQPITLSATGASVTISSDSSSSSQFVLSGASFPMTIPAGQTASFNVVFTPQSTGSISGALSFASNASTAPSVTLAGSGTAATGQLTITPASLNFGSVPDGTTQTQSITLGATGASVTISSSASSSSQFSLSGGSFPMTIPAGQSASFNVAFTPQSTGTVSGSVSFASNASNSGTPEALTGVGTVTQYSVNLSWNASSDVMGYNVYRSTAASGSYAKINSSPGANTAYTDSTVVSGQTYYYAATSVSSSGQESSLSTPAVQAVVP